MRAILKCSLQKYEVFRHGKMNKWKKRHPHQPYICCWLQYICHWRSSSIIHFFPSHANTLIFLTIKYVFESVILFRLICRVFFKRLRILSSDIIAVRRMRTISHFLFAIIIRNWNTSSLYFILHSDHVCCSSMLRFIIRMAIMGLDELEN